MVWGTQENDGLGFSQSMKPFLLNEAHIFNEYGRNDYEHLMMKMKPFCFRKGLIDLGVLIWGG